MFSSCRVVDVALPYREVFALALYCFGSGYSLSYELHRFWWKAQPENKGQLHTVGLAACASLLPGRFETEEIVSSFLGARE